MQKNSKVWGKDNEGNFTIGGKKPTKKQLRQFADSLKVPEKYRELIPVVEARLKSIGSRQKLTFPDSRFIREIRAINKSLKSKEILSVVGSLDPPYSKGVPAPSRMKYFLRLIYLQAEWEGISAQQVIDKALGRTKTSESTGTPVEEPNSQNVTRPQDEENYVRAKSLWRKDFDTYRQFKKWFGTNRDRIHHYHKGQIFMIHAADYHKVKDEEDSQEFNRLDSRLSDEEMATEFARKHTKKSRKKQGK